MEQRIRTQVIEDLVVRITLDGAFQHANIYYKTGEVSNSQRIAFRSFLANQLQETLRSIMEIPGYNDNCHYETIQKFSDIISNEFKGILANARLRIGVAQKLINLYWKFSWLLKLDVSKPIHCPFDSIVISALKLNGDRISWTKMESIEDYKTLIEACKKFLAETNSDNSIADWELELYYSKVNYADKYKA